LGWIPPVRLVCKLSHGPDRDCPGHATTKSPEQEAAIAPPNWRREKRSSLNSASLTPRPLASSVYMHVPEAHPLSNEGDPPCLFPPWPPGPRQGWAAGSDRFCLFELRVSQHFSTFYGSFVQAMDTQLGARHRRRPPTIHRGRAQRTISEGSFDEIQQVAGRDVCNAGQNLVGSHGGRRHPGIAGSPKRSFP
jgi:hypothetical protein